MNIVLLCSSDYLAISAALKLLERQWLSAVVFPERAGKQLLPLFMQAGIPSNLMHTVARAELETGLTTIIQQCEAQLVCVVTFPWKVPASVLKLPLYQCLNFHPGLLPQYRGADPVYWQIRNREPNGGFTVHVMTEQLDEGPILLTREMPVIPGETYGMHIKRLGMLAAELITDVVQCVTEHKPAQPQQPAQENNLYLRKPDQQQTTINWKQQTAAEIEAMVNAGNPRYNGARTTLRQMELAILEVSFATLNEAPAGIVPGTVIYADALYGIVVACINQEFLKVNTVYMYEGYLSGTKLFQLGFNTNDIFI